MPLRILFSLELLLLVDKLKITLICQALREIPCQRNVEVWTNENNHTSRIIFMLFVNCFESYFLFFYIVI